MAYSRHRSASPTCRANAAAGVVGEGARGEVWRAVALQAHYLAGPSRPPGPNRSFSAGSRQPGTRDARQAASRPNLGEYAELDYEEKQRRHQASLSLAQRMGLVAKPAQPLTSEQWEAVKKSSDSRQDSDVPCSICLDDFCERPQVILSCSHVFHGECLRSFEKFAGKRHCPLCRCPSYDATVHHTGFMVWRKKCASRIQRAWRGYKSRSEVFAQLRQPEFRCEAPSLHRRYCGRALRAVGGKLEKACGEREDALDRFLEELDGSVAKCSEQLREGLLGFEQLHGGGLAAGDPTDNIARAEAVQVQIETSTASRQEQPLAADTAVESSVVDAECWAKARRAALSRGDEVDCPICFQPCQLRGRSGGRVELLSCSHVFHRCCLMSFESFHVFEAHLCPVCRQQYERRPWQSPTQDAEGGRPPKLPTDAANSAPGTPASGSLAAGSWHVSSRARGRGRARVPGARSAATSSRSSNSNRVDYRVLQSLGR
mmetsp:Transcript_96303/g.171086  ORF Transcript_96303/g.171086 Transcript_96303/m.171086 type:complete len:487 (-) Transcript_96303:208-1668(-)